MAHDLFFGKSKRNFARSITPAPASTTPVSDEVTLVFSDAEKSMLDKISTARMKAETGDRNAIKQLLTFSKDMSKVKAKAAKGDPKAKRVLLVLRESGLFNKPQSISMLGSTEDKVTQLRIQLRQLRQKDPKTDQDRQAIEVLSEKLARVEAMSGIGAYPNPARKAARRARRARKLANLKSRAAAGDPRATARLQEMQQQLNQTIPTSATPYTPYAPVSPVAPVYPQAQAYPYQPPVSSPPPYYRDADGNFYQTQPQPGQGQPAIDVFVGTPSQRMNEEVAAEQEDRGIVIGSNCGGKSIPHENYRVAVMKAALKSSGGKRPSTKDYFQAKAAVDQTIGKSGITIYMPGAKPGRRTI